MQGGTRRLCVWLCNRRRRFGSVGTRRPRILDFLFKNLKKKCVAHMSNSAKFWDMCFSTRQGA